MNRLKSIGKIRRRLVEAKNQSFRPAKADFSHNESVRLATDAFLDGGVQSYFKALEEEGEVDFLSSEEVRYIERNATEPYYANDAHADGETGPRQTNDARSVQSGTYFPLASESSEPALFHTWSTTEKPYLKEKSSATVYFQTNKNSNIRDLIRRCINKTSQVLVILMDVFSDAEIFCDVLEAANKRRVFVYLLLDLSNLQLFTEMCNKLHVTEDQFKNISVRSVTGEVYCAKSGRKFSGQIQEKFIISDWRYVLSGSYSFTWLCGQVHRNFLSKFTGQVVELFDEEFRHLYASSKPVAGLRPPSHTTRVLLNETTAATQGSLSSGRGRTHTRSDLSSSGSNHSSSPPKQPPRSPAYNGQPLSPPPLNRAHPFQSYTPFKTTPPPSSVQVNYYQRKYITDSPATLYNSVNLYRSMRIWPEEVNRGPLNPVWRCLQKVNLIR
ncbi:protein FAM83A [Paroedura picta]|uniref:protein FAM83A n=1 Tax=Paroedura picta TaxID=143630 RepID=UPI004055A848